MRYNPLRYVKRLMMLLFVSVMSAVDLHAQGDEQSWYKSLNPVFGVSDNSFFDNREVHSPYQRSQTLFGSQLGVEAGLQFGPIERKKSQMDCNRKRRRKRSVAVLH